MLLATLGGSCSALVLLSCLLFVPSLSYNENMSSIETTAKTATQGSYGAKAQASAHSEPETQENESDSEPSSQVIEQGSPESDDAALEVDSSFSDTGNAHAYASNVQTASEPESHEDETSSDSTEAPSSVDGAETTDAGATSLQGIVAERLEEERPVQDKEAAAFFETVLEDGKPIAPEDIKKLADEPVAYTDNVNPRLQHGVLDSGCEIMSLAMALDSMGVAFDPIVIADNYLDFEGGMADGFVGNPYNGGGGFPAGIVKAANAYLIDNDSEYRAYDLTGNSFDTLVELTKHGYPVLIWTTSDFSEPYFHNVFEGGYQWYGNEHCVLLCGMNDDQVVVCDPLEGKIERNAERFREIYEQCGSMAVYVR